MSAHGEENISTVALMFEYKRWNLLLVKYSYHADRNVTSTGKKGLVISYVPVVYFSKSHIKNAPIEAQLLTKIFPRRGMASPTRFTAATRKALFTMRLTALPADVQ